MADFDRSYEPRDDEDLLIYSEEDLAQILSDVYVDTREIVDDEDAAQLIDVVYDRLTDTYYSHTDEQ